MSDIIAAVIATWGLVVVLIAAVGMIIDSEGLVLFSAYALSATGFVVILLGLGVLWYRALA